MRNCLTAAGAPNKLTEGINEDLREKVRQAQKNILNSGAREGSPELNKLVDARNKAIKDLVDSRRITNNFLLKPLSQIRKYVDPRIKDFQAGLTRAGEGLKKAGLITPKKVVSPPNTSSGGPVVPKETRASKFLKGVGKVGKGLGLVGVGLSLYDNVEKDGAAKGITKTVGGVAGAWGAGAAVTAGCTAIGVATAGVGGLACAGVALGVSYFGGKYGSDIAGWGYDRAEDLANFADDKVFKPVSRATETAVNKVKDVGEEAVDGGKKVLGP